MPVASRSTLGILLLVAASSASAQTYRQANAVLPAGLPTLTAARAQWQADAAALGVSLDTEGFESFAAGNPLTFGTMTMTLSGGTGFTPLSGNALITTEGTTVASFNTNGATSVLFTFGSAINAFGLDITSIDFTGTTGTFVDNLGNTRDLGFAPQFASATFFGITNAAGFTSVRLDFTGSEILNFDNVQWGPASTVPEPSTVLLVGGGLAALAALRRRRRA